MNQKLVNRLAVSLLMATFSTLACGHAGYSEAQPQDSDRQPLASATAETDQASVPSSKTKSIPSKLKPTLSTAEKVGEQKTPLKSGSAKTIAKIHAYQMDGRKAATLYVRNLPILTFVANEATPSASTKVGTQLASAPIKQPASAQTKSLNTNNVEADSRFAIASLQKISTSLTKTDLTPADLDAALVEVVPETTDSISATDPAARATAVAAKINQLYQADVNGKDITLKWEQVAGLAGGRYLIKSNQVEIAAIDRDTILPDTTQNLEQDALQATNRLRRLFGDAAPLSAIEGKSMFDPQLAFSGVIQRTMTGFASWYGPGFHGNRSASGEIFNQHALTAAHRTLPFGTRVVVTNLDNGQSVVVKINDRGPFHGNRVIDLSAGAARVLGLMQSGVAPVRVEVLAPDTISAN